MKPEAIDTLFSESHRVSDIQWAEDNDGTLFAIFSREDPIVKIDVANDTTEEITVEEAKELDLEIVENLEQDHPE